MFIAQAASDPTVAVILGILGAVSLVAVALIANRHGQQKVVEKVEAVQQQVQSPDDDERRSMREVLDDLGRGYTWIAQTIGALSASVERIEEASTTAAKVGRAAAKVGRENQQLLKEHLNKPVPNGHKVKPKRRRRRTTR